jgi:hypothetical protein
MGLPLQGINYLMEDPEDPEDRGGKPEHPANPPAPAASTGTRYPALQDMTIAEMSRPENDAKRMAAVASTNAAMPKAVPPLGKEVPGTLHYSVGGGPMRSRAPGQGGPAGEDFSASQGAGFGQAWTPARGGHGGYMQSDIESLPWEQRPESYKSSHLSPAQEAMSPLGAVREKSRLERETEAGRRKDYEASVTHLRDLATQATRQAQSLPAAERDKAIQGINSDLQDRIKTVTESFGIGARLTSNALYGGF